MNVHGKKKIWDDSSVEDFNKLKTSDILTKFNYWNPWLYVKYKHFKLNDEISMEFV